MFTVPRITESFIDSIMHEIEWHRYDDLHQHQNGELNADYLGFNQVAELKIFEEEPLLKIERQNKLADIYHLSGNLDNLVNIDFTNVDSSIKAKLEKEISKTLKTPIKKASKQLKVTAENHSISGDKVLIAVNNEFSSVGAYEFTRLMENRCKCDSSTITHLVAITVEYHQGAFDARIDAEVEVRKIHADHAWMFEERFRESFFNHFELCMTQMLTAPEMIENQLPQIQTIKFESNGVTFVKVAEQIPDSRFAQEI
ncbi:TPA: hypothetical protein NJ920_004626 [Vibrio parahaemolyticus]|nr:hypothetical protein [Vibrio parahaemolyticus]